jgi:hypothetical protein
MTRNIKSKMKNKTKQLTEVESEVKPEELDRLVCGYLHHDYIDISIVPDESAVNIKYRIPKPEHAMDFIGTLSCLIDELKKTAPIDIQGNGLKYDLEESVVFFRYDELIRSGFYFYTEKDKRVLIGSLQMIYRAVKDIGMEEEYIITRNRNDLINGVIDDTDD